MNPLFSKPHRWSLAVALCTSLGLQPAARAVEPVAPLNAAAWNGSAALFVGVGQFEEHSGLPALRYTTRDAVALAQLFIVELKLVPPTNTWLALSGASLPPEFEESLARLKKLGVRLIAAERKDLLKAVKSATDAASNPDGMLLVSLSSHGYEAGGGVFLMPSDGQSADVETTGLPLDSVRNSVLRARAGKRLVFVDACRQTTTATTRGDDRMTPAFYKALAAASGFGLVASCSNGQKSYEDEKFGHGVFTHFLLEGLRGKAESNPADGFIHLRQAVNYAQNQTKDYVWRTKSSEQDPWFSGDTPSLDIPLAMDPIQREKAKQLRERTGKALNAVTQARQHHPNIMSGDVLTHLIKTLDNTVGPELERVVVKCEEVGARTAEKNTFEDFVAWFRGRYPLPSSAEVTKPPPSAAPPPEKPTQTASQQPSLWIQIDPVDHSITEFWTTTYSARLRDQLAQGFREAGAFVIRSADLPSPGTRPVSTAAQSVDYVLTLRVDGFYKKLLPVQMGNAIFKVNFNSYEPQTTVTVGWSLKRVTDGTELGTRSCTDTKKGKKVSPPAGKRVSDTTLVRMAEWPDESVMSAVARCVVGEVGRVDLKR